MSEHNDAVLPELKPCPFCGEEPVFSTLTDTPRAFKVRCNFCWARSGDHRDIEAATNAWNTRISPQPQEAEKVLVEALKEIAAFDDGYASDRLEKTGRYTHFDEPSSVQIARGALKLYDEMKGGK